MTRGWAFFRKRNDWKRQARRWLLGSIRTATRQLVPSLPVLLLLASIAAVIVSRVRITAIP